MKISNLTECTTAGAVATVAQPFETVQKRTPEKKLKGSNLLKGIKTSAKYANSLHESEQVEEGLKFNGGIPDVDHMHGAIMRGGEGMSKACPHCNGNRYIWTNSEQGKTPKHPWINPNTATLKSKQIPCPACDGGRKKVPEGAIGKAVKRGMQGWAGTKMTPGSITKRSKELTNPELDDQIAGHTNSRLPEPGKHSPTGFQHRVLNREKKKRDVGTGEEHFEEGAKVDRMVGHVKSSEKKLGKSSKEAENIAWATANKRGMLDNKNKKVEESTEGWTANDFAGASITSNKTMSKLMRIPGFRKVSPQEQQRVAKAVDGYLARDMSFDQALVLAQKQGVAEGSGKQPKITLVPSTPGSWTRIDILVNDVKQFVAVKTVGPGFWSIFSIDGNDNIGGGCNKSELRASVLDHLSKQAVAEAAGREFKPGDSKPKQTPSKLTKDPEKIRQANALLKGSDKEKFNKDPSGYQRNLHTGRLSEQGVAEGQPKQQDLSGVSTEKLKAFVAKHSGGGVPTFGAGAQLKRVQAELRRREQGVAEGKQPATKEKPNPYAKSNPDTLANKKNKKVYKKKPEHNDYAQSEPDADYDDNKIDEGRFVKGPGGVPLDRQGNAIPPKPQAEPKAPNVRRDANGLTRADYNTVWRKIEDVVGQIFPDGDPIDWLGPWLDRQGIKDYHGGEVLNKACRLNGYKDIYAYYDHFKTDDYGYEDPKLKGFLDNGGQVQHGSFKGPRKAEKTDFGSTHIGGGGDKMKASRTGLAARSLGNKIVGLPEEKEKTNSEGDISTITDPELRHAIEKAKTHYGGIKDPITAFRKLTVRGLKHAEETDHRQDEKIKDFEQVINRMKQEIFSLRQRVSSPVSEGEITEDDVVLSADRRKPKSGLLSKPEPTTNPADTVKLDVPLLIRLLEFSKEDAVDDMALHDLAEKLVAGCQRGRTLTMKDYDSLVPAKQPEVPEPGMDESLLGGAAAAGIVANDDDDDFQVSYQRKMSE